MTKNVIPEMERKMKSSLSDLERDLSGLRTGRASPALLDKIMVDYYGTATALKVLAGITMPEPRQLLVTPFDKTTAGAIANAISKSDLGLQAVKDGDSVRVSVPHLNEERRKEMVKLAGRQAEAHKVAIRNIRRDANDHLKKLEKDGELSKDELHTMEAEVQKVTDRQVADIDKMKAAKEAEIMEV